MPGERPLGVQEGVTLEQGKTILETEHLVLTEFTEQDIPLSLWKSDKEQF